MSNFRVGQRLVCVRKFIFPDGREPEVNEMVTVSGYSKDWDNHIHLKEYPTDNNGESQCFPVSYFRPLDDTLAEETEAMVQKFATGIEEYLEIIKETETIKNK